jgi:hypothetical protein
MVGDRDCSPLTPHVPAEYVPHVPPRQENSFSFNHLPTTREVVMANFYKSR